MGYKWSEVQILSPRLNNQARSSRVNWLLAWFYTSLTPLFYSKSSKNVPIVYQLALLAVSPAMVAAPIAAFLDLSKLALPPLYSTLLHVWHCMRIRERSCGFSPPANGSGLIFPPLEMGEELQRTFFFVIRPLNEFSGRGEKFAGFSCIW